MLYSRQTMMKVRSRSTDGSLLLPTLAVALVGGVAVAGVLTLASWHHQAMVRAEVWNYALALAEAGVEEALGHLNHQPEAWTANGWTNQGSLRVKERTIATDRYRVTVTTNTDPVITSQAFARLPGSAQTLSRRVQVTTQKQSVLPRGMVTRGKITVSGTVRTDSYISSDPAYSTNGRYDPAKRRDNGFLSSSSTASAAVEISGDAEINGKVSVGGASTLKLDAPASVGSPAWTANPAHAGAVQPGYLDTGFNSTFPNVVAPSTAGAPTIGGTGGVTGGTNYTYRLGSGIYTTSDLVLDVGQALLVSGDASLVVNNSVDVKGTGYIYLAPGATLKLYVANTAYLSGGGVVNGGGKPRDFVLYGLPSCEQIYYSGSSGLVGLVYAPQAKMDLTGTSHFMGASISDEVVLGGSMQYHYDEDLELSFQKYAAFTWDEL